MVSIFGVAVDVAAGSSLIGGVVGVAEDKLVSSYEEAAAAVGVVVVTVCLVGVVDCALVLIGGRHCAHGCLCCYCNCWQPWFHSQTCLVSVGERPWDASLRVVVWRA